MAAGTFALSLRGIDLSHVGAEPVRFVLTPRRFRPTTYAPRALDAAQDLLARSAGNDRRHVTVIRGAPIAAVTRPAARLGRASWVEHDGIGAHALEISDAFISLLEHPRLSGGYACARHAALPVLGHVGVDALIEADARHPVLSFRRRLPFVLMRAVLRTERAISWMGPDEDGWTDDT